ncbi:putative rhamnosyl transferase [Cognatishimia sp.]|uniref:putative rhamnosyl transferase n=1 Tax=Cognatishimia sp. TaxID=2211648 RepID=UPI003514417A
MKSQDMQVIGLCRFSYPAYGGFQVGHETLEERRAYLYAPERIEERFRSFEAIALPSIRAQTDPNFTFLIAIGECLPAPYLERLNDLVADVPQAVLVPWPSERHRPAMQKIINKYKADTDLPSIQFRHDDDDAVAINFVERLREAVDDSASIIAKNDMLTIDFNRGFSGRPTPQGLEITPSVLQYYGVALGMVAQPNVQRSIMNFSHKKMNQAMPSVTFTDQEMFLRGHGDFNDSRQKSNVARLDFQPMDDEAETLFKQLFAIDNNRVREIYSAS